MKLIVLTELVNLEYFKEFTPPLKCLLETKRLMELISLPYYTTPDKKKK
jgi:hypothetical protein